MSEVISSAVCPVKFKAANSPDFSLLKYIIVRELSFFCKVLN